MPRTVKLAVPLALPADVYHALRSDRGFDLYCADKEGANFMLHSEGRTTDAGPHEITCTYSYKSLPKIMSAVLGSSARLEILSKMLYTPHLFGDANPTLVTTNPNVFGGRISTESRCYLEPTASGACILHVSATVDVRVFGVGTLVEGIFMGFLRDSYDKLEALALEYVRTPAFAAFASDEARMVMAPRATSARALTISAFKKRDNGAGASHARAPTHDLLARAPSASETTDVTDPDLDDGATLAADDEFVVLHELTNDAEESRGVKGSHALPSAVLGTDLADGARLTFDSAVLGTGLAAADGARLTFDATTTTIPKGSSTPGSSSYEGRLESSGIARSPEHIPGAVSGARSPEHVTGAVSGAPQDEPQTIDRVKGALSDMAASVGEGVEDLCAQPTPGHRGGGA
ncbi:hypothetical protein Ctob_005367 [Chrysochromulina tobinii]|uniref:Uncharacterized protein n=1 Tax=Chrysochromulina tobinii TaxID=1460289 RepID=A0A0M0JXQ5_9EUKA|nr:hypothetical protein Ctob_005367 [Chrysochromulina tobinii]|eukprot:KOO31349.1 hypothetical protein Ctob_005367 [Chrysochromulina sp. CCMP291]